MKELVRTNDAVRLSWLQAVLAEAGIETLVLDSHTSIVAIPRRLMVADADHFRASAALRQAEAELG